MLAHRFLVLLLVLAAAEVGSTAGVGGDPPATCPLRSTAQVPLLDGGIPQPCDGIRPGTEIVAPAGCTLAWILRDADGNLYASTAGHCIPDDEDDLRVFVSPHAVPRLLPGQTPEHVFLGVPVFAHQGDEGADIAFIRIDDRVKAQVDPQLCHWGGPTGLYTGLENGTTVRQYGHGIVVNIQPETRARSGIMSFINDTAYGYYGLVTNGDSGSPVMTADGGAVGVLDTLGTHFGFGGDAENPEAVAHVGGAGTRLTEGIAMFKAATGIHLELVTAPLAS